MATIKCSNEQLRLIQDSLELYSRVGIMQLDHLLYHPSIIGMIENQCTPKTPIKVGDSTSRGEVVEIGKDYFKTKGNWCDWKERATPEEIEAYPKGWKEEIRTWTDMKALKHGVDYNKYHPLCDDIKRKLNEVKNMITADGNIMNINASYGIGRTTEGQHNIDAYDMIQVIRHEFWKAQENRNEYVVSSNVCKFGLNPLIEVEL